ncbi:YjbH domain-containing protein [Gammaproteobacteria bacterium]|nr:YjbH domain-containing protein [Gammaproteobacteria bacterium]
MQRLYLLAIIIYSSFLYASIDDYKYRFKSHTFSSYGTIGLIQMPTARIHEAGSIGIVFSNFDPYQRISIVAYPFDWVEALYHYTDVRTKLYSDSYAFSGNQTYKDKGFDLKFRIRKESRYIPSIALGFRDLAGTGIFAAEYIAMSKYAFGADFTFGMGWGTLNGPFGSNISNPFTTISDSFKSRENYSGKGGELSTGSYFSGEKMGIYAGVEYVLPYSDGLGFKLEYDGTNYDAEGFKAPKQDKKWNLGMSYSLSEAIKLNLGYIRGNTVQLGFSIAGNFGKKTKIKKSEKHQPVQDQNILKKITARDDRYLYLSALKYLNERSLFLRTADLTENDKSLTVSYAQNKHISYPRSYGRAIRVLDEIAPESIEEFILIPMNVNYELSSIAIDRAVFRRNLKNNDYKSLEDATKITQGFRQTKLHQFKPGSDYPKSFLEHGFTAQTHIGGADRFFVGGVNYKLQTETLFARNISLQSSFRAGIFDTFEVLDQPSDSIIQHVRTDIIDYLKEGQDFNIARLQLNIFNNPFQSVYTKFSIGILEEMFSGVGGEVLYRPFDSLWAIGANAYKVKQRDYDQLLKHKEYETLTGHINLYFIEPRSNILLKISGGRYLAEDSGITFDFSREFTSGLRLGGYFTRTDISAEEFGEGSFDKGFYINFPLEALFSGYSRDFFSFGLRPLTRDGGAMLLVGHDLYGVTDQASSYNIRKNMDSYYD